MSDQFPPEGIPPDHTPDSVKKIIDALLKGVREAKEEQTKKDKLPMLPNSFSAAQIEDIQLSAEYTHEQISAIFAAFSAIAIKSEDSCIMIGFTQAMLQMVRKVLTAVASEKYLYDVFLTTLLGPGVIAAANKAYEVAKQHDPNNS